MYKLCVFSYCICNRYTVMSIIVIIIVLLVIVSAFATRVYVKTLLYNV